MLILLTVLCSSLAALTGILAVGNGRHWEFDVFDYFRGKRNAILYLWVIASTIFSILHAGVVAEYGLNNGWQLRGVDSFLWMALEATMGLLLVCAHLFVGYTLSKEIGTVDKFLWGKNRVR